jgi:hypothetical protein
MKDDGFLIFIGMILLIGAIFTVEPIDITATRPNPGVITNRTSSTQTRSSTPANSLSGIEKQLNDAETRAEELQEEISELEKKQTQSEYFGLVEIRQLSTTSSLDGSKEYIRLSASRKIDTPIDITGWKIVSDRTNNQVTIPSGTNLYRPNSQYVRSNILLDKNATVYINTGESPVSTSFKVNICSGYHEQFNYFNPRISLRCPYPDADIVGVPDTIPNEACLEYIDRMPRCKIQTTEIEQVLGNDCNTYIYQKVNYPTCVDNHSTDDNFYKNEWRIFLERRHPLWRKSKETLNLYDNVGKLVDTYKK